MNTFKILEINKKESWIKIEVVLPDDSKYVKRMTVNMTPTAESTDEDGTVSPAKTTEDRIIEQVAAWYNQYIKDIDVPKPDDTAKVGKNYKIEKKEK